MPLISIIIPTHKRAAILQQCLEHLGKQTAVDQLEVIVVSDGEDPEAEKTVKRSYKYPYNFIAIPKSHQGVARNRGIEKAQGKYCMFIGDDIFLAPNAVEKHLEKLSAISDPTFAKATVGKQRLAVLGFTTWDPSLDITSVMRWLEESGWQFGYPLLKNYEDDDVPEDIQHRFTYTSHISLPTEIVRAHPFREDVSLYGWEDIEWGLRLKQSGIKLYYCPSATAYHHHHMTLEQSLQRMETLGQSVVHLSRIVPELDRRPRGWKLMLYQIAAWMPTMGGRHRKAFLKGMKRKDAEES